MNDLIPCPKCNRNNGARRMTCMYCGEALPVTQESMGTQVPNLRQVEDWEKGYSVVLIPLDREAPTSGQIRRLADVTKMEEELAVEAFDAHTPLPVARVSSIEEAQMVSNLLGASDLGTTIVSDADLDLRRVCRRVRKLELEGETLRLNILWGDWVEIPRADVVKVVEGRIVSIKTEIYETQGQVAKREMVETSEFHTESFALDIYGPTLDASFRVNALSFDFSSLGERPNIVLESNVNRLGALLSSFLGASRYDRDFRGVARILNHAWPPAARVDRRGATRRGDYRKYEMSAVETDVLAQFTRYSRMRYVLAGSAGAAPSATK